MSFCIYQYNVFGRAFGLGNIGKSVIAISGAFILKVAFHGGNVFSLLRAPRKISIWQWLFGHEKAAKWVADPTNLMSTTNEIA
jgi:hypothetical protein